MKAKVYKSILFLVVFFVLDNIVYAGFSFLHNKSSLLDFLEERPDIIYVGDSQILHGVIPKIIEEKTGMSGYNLASEGSGVIFAKGIQSVVLNYYRPKVFVLEAMNIRNERGARSRLAPYFKLKEVKQLFSFYPYHIRFMYSYIKSARYNSMLLTILKAQFFTSKHSATDGYLPKYGKRQKARTFWSNKPKKTIDYATSERYLEGFVKEANKNNITVIFVRMPTLIGDREYYDLYKDIAKKHGAIFLNLGTEGIYKQLPQEYFYDHLHLNNDGAILFSSIFGKEIERNINR